MADSGLARWQRSTAGLALAFALGSLMAAGAASADEDGEQDQPPRAQRPARDDAAPKVGESAPREKNYRGRLGPDSNKIKTENGRTYVWAAGDPESAEAKWYDFTGTPFPASDLQFGIGQDRIPAIDDPLFVDPDDPRLLKLPPSPYRRNERPKSNDEIMIIGYAEGDDVRAYPAALLDGHELVNDRVGGKPVTVGW